MLSGDIFVTKAIQFCCHLITLRSDNKRVTDNSDNRQIKSRRSCLVQN